MWNNISSNFLEKNKSIKKEFNFFLYSSKQKNSTAQDDLKNFTKSNTYENTGWPASIVG